LGEEAKLLNFWPKSKPSQFLPQLVFICVFYGVEVGLVDDARSIFILLRLVLFALWYVLVVHSLKGFCILLRFFGGPRGKAKLMQHLKRLLLKLYS